MKPFKLLIGYDGSDCSKKVLQELSGAGLPPSVEAVILNIADTWPPVDSSVKPEEDNWVTRAVEKTDAQKRQLVEDARVIAWQAAEVLSRRFPAWTIRSEGKADSPAWGIVHFADQWKPDLIVLGYHGRSAVGRFLLGSVSQKVLAHASCAVRIIHPASKLHLSPKLLVAFDGSADSRRAIYQVTGRTWPKGTQVRLVSVMDGKIAALAEAGLARDGRRLHTPAERKRLWTKQVIQPALQELKKPGLLISSVVSEGDPAGSLLQEAKRWKADCIFLSARGMNAVERFLLGSVSTNVAAHAPCSVEIVR
jgi:nucleotide-binding universal stress UspA family protein